MNIVTIVGARPQFIKAAVLSRIIRSKDFRNEVTEYLVHTGQHYDDNMSDVFFREMMIPEPDVNLGVGSGPHGEMTGEMLRKIELVLLDRKPDFVMVYGDTNSTLAGALAAGKLHIPVVHIEAGLRSYDMRMPEEQNRVLTDHLSMYLFCPTDRAVGNLIREGIPRPSVSGKPACVKGVGDVMLDASLFYRDMARKRPREGRVSIRLGLPRNFRLLTIHRAENTDDTGRLTSIIEALNACDDTPIVFPVHPRTRKILDVRDIKFSAHIRPVEPVGYLDMLELEEACSAVITDSGGVQKEAYFFQKPCITLRDHTEWVETVEAGWNKLVGADRESIARALVGNHRPDSWPPFYGDGTSGRRIIAELTANALTGHR